MSIDPSELSSKDVIDELKTKVFGQGRSVVPLLGAGISSEAGVPRLAEVTEYLAKTKGYIRHKVYARVRSETTVPWEDEDWRSVLQLPAFSTLPRDFLRQFGWPDPQELDSDLRHWIERQKTVPGHRYPRSLQQVVVGEVLDSLGSIDHRMVRDLLNYAPGVDAETILQRIDNLHGVGGRFWKILLTEMTRSSEDLIDTLFQRLTLKRYPATSHRFLALLTPILRLRLFLTTNFDRLLEEALRAEGHEPTVFEVADGLTLPHPKLMQSGLSIIKLHGGAYGLLVGDRLDSPLDEETRERFRAYLPDRPILLVLGFGGEDQRVLDMLELVDDCGGEVYWLYFQNYRPHLLIDRFSRGAGQLASFIKMASVQDPGAFLRQFYSELTRAHPSSSLPFKFSHLPPVLPGPGENTTFPETPVVVFPEQPGIGRIESAKALARIVAQKRSTHQPIWIDIETKFTLESLVTDIIQQLRRFDPGLPPELVALERLTAQGRRGVESAGGLQKVVRRLYASMARGRYLLALNGVASFGSQPTRHHTADPPPGVSARRGLSREQEYFVDFVRTLIDWQKARPRNGSAPIECLGIQDSILAMTLDHPDTAEGDRLYGKLESLLRGAENTEFYEGKDPDLEAVNATTRRARQIAADPLADPALVLITACRRRRNSSALANLLPKYLALTSDEADRVDDSTVRDKLDSLVEEGLLTFLEGGDAWMGRKLRNLIYEAMRTRVAQGPEPIRAAATLAFAHLDLATYFYREIYTGSQDAQALSEALYHRWAYLKYLQRLQLRAGDAVDPDREQPWIEKLQRHPVDDELETGVGQGPGGVFWLGANPIVENDTLDGTAIAYRRIRGLRSLINLLDQEREPLLRRVSAAALKAWIRSIRHEASEIVGVDGLEDGLASEIRALRECLLDFLDDLEVDLRTDRLDSDAILRCRHYGVRKLVDPEGEPSGSTASERWLWDPAIAPNEEQLLGFFRQPGGDSAAERYRTERNKNRVFRAILDVLWARTRNPWLAPDVPDLEALLSLPDRLLEAWREGNPSELPSNTMLESRARLQVLRADVALWGISPWDAKGRGLGVLEHTHSQAQTALLACEEGLRILDETREDDRATRSYFYSLKGRAKYLLEEFDQAYRQLDRARSVLQEHTMVDLEPRAIALLRQAESLMLHADHELTHWAIDRLEEFPRPVEEASETASTLPWELFLSHEGRRKLKRGLQATSPPDGSEDPARTLLALSLANHAPEALRVLENLTHADYFPQREIPLGTLRSRLDSAKSVLDRAEKALEGGRRNVQWWGCLFQLRAQLAIEQLLLLLTGDFSSLGTDASARPGKRPTRSQIDGEMTDWLGEQNQRLAASGSTPAALSMPKDLADRLRFGAVDPLATGEARKRFISRFRSLVRQGLVAVRQGLDILLPSPDDRTRARLRGDVLIRRLLRLWAELLVCGASAHITSERSNPNQTLDFKAREDHEHTTRSEQWEEWLFLNQLSGLVHLPSPPELKKHFEDLYSFGAENPGLAARAQTLAKIDYLLSKRGKKNKTAGDAPPPPSVLEILVRELEGDSPSPGGSSS